MKEKLTQRRQKLQAELEAGQKLQADYETKQSQLHETLLRISGAIIVLDEMIAEADSDGNGVVSGSTVNVEQLPIGELEAAGEV